MRIVALFLPVALFAAPPAQAFDPAPLAGLPDAIARGDYPKTTSVLIVQDGKTVYERYFGEGSPERLNNTRSATKVFAALAIGEAIADGAMPSEYVPAFAYLSDLKPFQNDTADKEAITIADMLSMSSALDCDDNDDKSPGNEDNMHPQPSWTRWAADLPTMKGYARDASGRGPWRYCTANAFLTGQVVQRATHTPVDRYIEDRLLRPLGIEKWNWSYSPAHETMTGGGLELRTRDWAKIAWMLEDGGRWQGRQIVPSAWVDAVFTIRRASRPDQNYGYFAFEGNYETACGAQPVWYVAGNGGSQILFLHALHAAVVVTRENYNVRGTSQQTVDLLQKYVLPALPCMP
ncbi:MAG TPA: serine hydrolase [Rhizomicrobium sp.]|jgi:CubicO group peptidase (beta-lactamase class C family)